MQSSATHSSGSRSYCTTLSSSPSPTRTPKQPRFFHRFALLQTAASFIQACLALAAGSHSAPFSVAVAASVTRQLPAGSGESGPLRPPPPVSVCPPFPLFVSLLRALPSSYSSLPPPTPPAPPLSQPLLIIRDARAHTHA